MAIGTIGYVLLGFGYLDAFYETVTTISTVGFRELQPFGKSEQIFTIFLVLGGVGTTLYASGVVLESVIEGRLTGSFGRRRMERRIDKLTGHVVVCGWGRVGRAVAATVTGHGTDVVIVDRDPSRLADAGVLHVVGDVTDDATLRAAG